jgi:tetratricopeptide (TPR) repeat protein
VSDFPQILAFYSFKGGVGRSMALMNLAYAMAAKGRNVLVLDMDLEAPGLSGFMRRQNEVGRYARHDLVDLLLWAKQTADLASEEAPLDPNLLPPLSDYAVRVPTDNLAKIPERSWDLGRLDVIPIDESRDYYNRLSEVAVAGMDRVALLRVGSLLRAWLKSRRIPLDVPDYYGPVPDEDRSATYDYVLVDSRTGITEVGGLCIGPLSDQLVVLCGLNDQNVEGTRQFLTEVGVLKTSSAGTAMPSAKPTLFVASPLPIGEMTTKSERLKRLENAFDPKPRLFKLSYHPQMALMETIFVRDHQHELLTQEYHLILAELLRRSRTKSDFNPMKMPDFSDSKTRLSDKVRKNVRSLLRSADGHDSRLWLIYALIRSRDLATVTDDLDFQLMDRVCRAVASIESPGLDVWPDLLSRWALISTDSILATRRFEEATHKIEQIIKDPETSFQDRVNAIIKRGDTFGLMGDFDLAIDDFTEVIEMSDAPVERKAQALFNRGITFGRLGSSDREIEDYTAVIEMPDAPIAWKAKALSKRSWKELMAGRIKEAISDSREAKRLNREDAYASGKLAVALLVDHQLNDAVAAYEMAIMLADVDALAELEKDLKDAIDKHGAIAGADEILQRIGDRKVTLKAISDHK